MKRIDKFIKLIREQMVANAPGTQGGFSGSSDTKGPTAGFDPSILKSPMKRKFAKGGVGSRKNWLNYLKNK